MSQACRACRWSSPSPCEDSTARDVEDECLDPLGLTPEGKPTDPTDEAYYRLSFEKIVRMLERLRANGFTSFTEA